jgi:hypothetical protein
MPVHEIIMLHLTRRRVLAAPIAAAALGACTVQPVATEVAVVRAEPPAPRYEVVPVLAPERAAREYWQPGHWRWDGREHVWVPGHYAVRPRPGAVWVAHHWERRGAGWVLIEGHWT